MTQICQACRATLPNGARFCPHCGRKVHTGSGKIVVLILILFGLILFALLLLAARITHPVRAPMRSTTLYDHYQRR